MATERFFFYGSMSEGMVHYNKVKNFIESQVPATIRAQAFRLKVGFPVLVKNPIDTIHGMIVELKTSEILLSLMDSFFGVHPTNPALGLHERQKQLVQIGSELVEAWVYFVNPKKMPKDSVLIEGGDWFKSMQDVPPMTQGLSEKQIIYIKKLGTASGRDIVPINDLTLYRELMKLELIVDKGRRLALSKLGQDVYRHIS